MASRTPGPTTLIVSPKGQITLPKPVRARLRLAPGSVLLLRVEAGKIVLDPVALYASEEIERLVVADRVNPRERAALRRRWGLKAVARRHRGPGLMGGGAPGVIIVTIPVWRGR
jgi:AbrB family looped-hinge helix DNA binding protein